MKLIKKLLIVLSIVIAVPAVSFAPPAATQVSAASLSGNKLTMTEGEEYSLSIPGVSGKITWKSKNKKIATVNKKGNVRAYSAGTTKIIAKYGGTTKKFKLTVKAKGNSSNTGSKSTVDKNVREVVDTIKREGTPYYATIYMEDLQVLEGGQIVEASIRYIESLDSLRFIVEMNQDGLKVTSATDYVISSKKAIPVHIMFTGLLNEGYTTGADKVDPSSLNSTNSNLTWKGTGSRALGSDENRMVNVWYSTTLQAYDLLMHDLFGMRLGDIGFSRFPTTR